MKELLKLLLLKKNKIESSLFTFLYHLLLDKYFFLFYGIWSNIKTNGFFKSKLCRDYKNVAKGKIYMYHVC